MTRTLLVARGGFGKPAMHRASSRGKHRCRQHCADEGVDEPHTIAADLDELRGERSLEALFRSRAGGSLDRVDGGIREQGHREQRLPRALGELREPRGEQSDYLVGYGQRLPGNWPYSSIGKGPRELDRQQGVAARSLFDSLQGRTRQSYAELRVDRVVDGAQGERAERNSVPVAREELAEPERVGGRLGVLPQCHDHSDPNAGLESPQGERERGFRRSVEPLHVVDRNQHRGLFREPPENREQPGGYRTRRGSCGARRGAEQSSLDCLSLRIGERRERAVVDGRQKVGQRGEPELRLGLRGTAAKNVEARAFAESHRFLQHGRLADPRFPDDQQRGELLESALEEPLDDRELAVATDHRPHEAQCATFRRRREVGRAGER